MTNEIDPLERRMITELPRQLDEAVRPLDAATIARVATSRGRPSIVRITAVTAVVAIATITAVVAVEGLTGAIRQPGGPPAISQSPGQITFGSAVNELTGEVENPQTTFRLSDDIAWSASLHAPVEGTKVNLDITTKDGAWVFGYEQFVIDPEGTRLVNEMPLGRFLPDPGVYIMRYVSLDGEVLAAGEFELIAESD